MSVNKGYETDVKPISSGTGALATKRKHFAEDDIVPNKNEEESKDVPGPRKGTIQNMFQSIIHKQIREPFPQNQTTP